MEDIVVYLKKKELTISVMESCTGGYIANQITNIEGSSEVFSFGAVTYSNQYKIKFGVKKETIEKYSVYSIETVKEMAKSISDYTGSSYGVGISGKLNREDINNPSNNDSDIYVCVYDSIKDKYFTLFLKAKFKTREENKKYILENIVSMFKREILL